MNKIKGQVITDEYAIYNADNMDIMVTLPDDSVDLVVYSPPFSSKEAGALYSYSSDHRDMSNCATNEEFLTQYGFLVKELSRVTKPGRINAVHCTDLIQHDGRLADFPHEIIKLYEGNGFKLYNRITIWKEPLRVRTRTMVQSLMHKFIVEDSTKCFTAMPDYVLIFKKNGDNEVPVTHNSGLTKYYGDTPILPAMVGIFNRANETNFDAVQLWDYLKNTYADHQDPKSNKLSHYIWQRYASSVWDDIRIDNVLPFRDSKEEDDEKHVHPSQLDVIDRLVDLYSNPNEVVLTPFMGVGSEVYSPVSLGRKAIGIELKDSYFKQATINLSLANERFNDELMQEALF